MFKMIKAFIFDIDGTLCLGDKAIDGAVETIIALERMNRQVFYLTNNSSKSRLQIVDKLRGLGFPVNLNCTYSTSYAISCYLTDKKISLAHVIGSDHLKSDLASNYVNVEAIDFSQSAAVVVCLDVGFNYKKIVIALHAIRSGSQLIVANVDSNYPAGNGRVLPGCGAIVGAIVGASGRQPDFMVGKPNTFMLELLCKEHGQTSEEICVVGDMPEIDIQMTVNFRCLGILFDPEDLYRTFPGAKVKKLKSIIPMLEKEKGG